VLPGRDGASSDHPTEKTMRAACFLLVL